MKEKIEKVKIWCKTHKEDIAAGVLIILCEVACAEAGFVTGFSVGRVRGMHELVEILGSAENLMGPGE